MNVSDNDPSGYRVPLDNPFIGAGPAGTRPEIWSFGLRNPWCYSFDDRARGGTGALLIGDVGQGQWEEIDYEPPVAADAAVFRPSTGIWYIVNSSTGTARSTNGGSTETSRSGRAERTVRPAHSEIAPVVGIKRW